MINEILQNANNGIEWIDWQWVTIINLIASVVWTFVLFPQSWKTIKTRDTVSVSLIMYSLYPICGLLWIAYASAMILIGQNPMDNIGIIITDSIGFVLSSIVLIIKIINMVNAKKMKLSELEYYEKCIKNNKKKKNVKK